MHPSGIGPLPSLRAAVGAAALLLLASVTDARSAPRERAPLDVVLAHLAAENTHDLDGLVATLADTLEMRAAVVPGDGAHRLDRAAARRTYARAFQAAPASRFRIMEQIVSGPWVITREQATGLPGGVRDVGLTAYRVEGGRITALWILNTEREQPHP